MKKIKVVVKRPFEAPTVQEVTAKLDAFQSLVGGLIEAVEVDEYGAEHNIVAYINDEGKLNSELPNLRLPWGD